MVKITREFYIPKNAKKQEYPELLAVVYTATTANGRPYAVCFSGKKAKPDLRYSYRSVEQMEWAIQGWLDGLKRLKQERKARAQARAARTALSEPAHSAKILKGYLKEFFPGVKFSVKSETFSDGNSIDVRYTDGPPYEEVARIADLFQYGSFDGMTDSYNYRPIKVGCAGAKYVFVERSYSPELKAALLPILQKQYAPKWDNGEEFDHYAPWQQIKAEMAYRNISQEEIDRRTQERIEFVTAMGVLAS